MKEKREYTDRTYRVKGKVGEFKEKQGGPRGGESREKRIRRKEKKILT